MNATQLQEFLLYSFIINYAILVVWWLLLIIAGERIYNLHRRWFALSNEQFAKIHYSAAAFYKILVIMFNVVPWLVLWLLSNN